MNTNEVRPTADAIGYWGTRVRCESETSRGLPCQRFTRVTYDGVPLCATHAPKEWQ